MPGDWRGDDFQLDQVEADRSRFSRHVKPDIPKMKIPDGQVPVTGSPTSGNLHGSGSPIPGAGMGNPLTWIATVVPVHKIVSKPMDALTTLGLSHCIIILVLVVCILLMLTLFVRRHRKNHRGYRDVIRRVSSGQYREKNGEKRKKTE